MLCELIYRWAVQTSGHWNCLFLKGYEGYVKVSLWQGILCMRASTCQCLLVLCWCKSSRTGQWDTRFVRSLMRWLKNIRVGHNICINNVHQCLLIMWYGDQIYIRLIAFLWTLPNGDHIYIRLTAFLWLSWVSQAMVLSIPMNEQTKVESTIG